MPHRGMEAAVLGLLCFLLLFFIFCRYVGMRAFVSGGAKDVAYLAAGPSADPWYKPAWVKASLGPRNMAVARCSPVPQQALKGEASCVSPACWVNSTRAIKSEAAWWG